MLLFGEHHSQTELDTLVKYEERGFAITDFHETNPEVANARAIGDERCAFFCFGAAGAPIPPEHAPCHPSRERFALGIRGVSHLRGPQSLPAAATGSTIA